MKDGQHINRQRSQGAVLLISLILLLVMTLISVGALDNATLESQMVRAMQWNQRAYQIALSEINNHLDTIIVGEDITDLLATMNTGSPVDYDNDSVGFSDGHAAQTSSIAFTGQSAPPDGFSTDDYQGLLFIINSTADVTGTGANSDQTQGINYAGPKN